MLSHADYALTELCVWREAQGEGRAGQIAVAWVIKNRSDTSGLSPYEVVTTKWQFSSMTAPGDPNLGKFGNALDPIWQQCQIIADGVLEGTISDPVSGATLYYNPNAIETTATIVLPNGNSIPYPHGWDKNVHFVSQIGKHYFFKEP